MDAAAHASWSADGISHSVFAIEGMRCAACSRAVTRAVSALPGVHRVSVNVATGRAAVDWDPAQVSLRRVLDAVARTGFTPVPLAGEAAAAQRRTERRRALKRIGLAGLGMMQTMMLVYSVYAAGTHGIEPAIAQYLKVAALLMATPVLVYSGAPFFIGAVASLRRGAPGMDVPVAVALSLAYGASTVNTLRGTGDIYFDSVAMFIFFLLSGRFVEMSVRQRNLSATEALARTLPARVARLTPTAGTERILPGQIEPGDRLLVATGAVIPVDATLEETETQVDESLVTGESVALSRRRGETLLGGSINLGPPVTVRATARASTSMLASIVGLLERTQAERPALARSADRLASWFVVFTLTLAASAAAVWLVIEPARALPAALAVLVVTCPCALSLATPAAIAAATGQLARSGLLVTRPDALERLARVDVVVVDKTGTLTHGAPAVHVTALAPGRSQAEACEIAAALERASDHPVALAFRAHPTQRVAAAPREIAGQGVEGILDGVLWRLGRREFVAELAHGTAPTLAAARGGELVLGSADGLLATFGVSDTLRPEAAQAVEQLRRMGLTLAIASGDHGSVVEEVARQLGIEEAAGHLAPADKLRLIRARQDAGQHVLMVGDGINDGPVLAASFVSCAMAEGSAVAQAAADLLLLNESLGALAQGIRAARRTRTVVRQNLAWALLYNVAAVPLAALGWIPPWAAAIGMSVSSLLVVLNAARLARVGRPVRPARQPCPAAPAGEGVQPPQALVTRP